MLLSLLFCLVHSWLSTIENWTSEQTVCKVCYSINHFQNPCAACYSPISSLSPDIKPVPNILLIVVDAPLQFLWSFAPVIKYHLLPVKLELNSTQHAKIIAKKKKSISLSFLICPYSWYQIIRPYTHPSVISAHTEQWNKAGSQHLYKLALSWNGKEKAQQ